MSLLIALFFFLKCFSYIYTFSSCTTETMNMKKTVECKNKQNLNLTMKSQN